MQRPTVYLVFCGVIIIEIVFTFIFKIMYYVTTARKKNNKILLTI